MRHLVSDGVGVIVAQVKVVRHLDTEVLAFTGTKVLLIALDGLVKRDERGHSRRVRQQFLKGEVRFVGAGQVVHILADSVRQVDLPVIVQLHLVETLGDVGGQGGEILDGLAHQDAAAGGVLVDADRQCAFADNLPEAGFHRRRHGGGRELVGVNDGAVVRQ